jgi:hypothetical protein
VEDEEHVCILRQGAEVWNQWRQENPAVEPDLRDVNLRDTNLGGANLHRANLFHEAQAHATRARVLAGAVGYIQPSRWAVTPHQMNRGFITKRLLAGV